MFYKQKKFEQDIQRTYNATIIIAEKLCVFTLAFVIRCAKRILSAQYYEVYLKSNETGAIIFY
jgi:hypothetical protein